MSHATLSASIIAVAVLVALAAVAPATADTYLTNTVTLTKIRQVIVGSSTIRYPMILVNYTTTSSSSIYGWLYLSLVSSAGQTVSLSVVYHSFGGGAAGSIYVPIQPSAAGNYTARAFATTTDNVALSTVSSIQVTV